MGGTKSSPMPSTARAPAVALDDSDYLQADPVLDRATGILRFEFEKELARAGIERGHFDQWGIAGQAEHGGGGIYRRLLR